MEDVISVLIFVSVLQSMLLNVKSYDLKCPLNVSWRIRAKLKCNSTLKYYCLYNNVEGKYVEGCTGPDWDRKGSKRIFSGSFTRDDCIHKRFQPFIFWTNGSLSDCVFAKSKCSEEGQLVYKEESANDDRTCRCDYERNYSFIKTKRNVCYCIPTEEDCSCYDTSNNSTISADESYTQSGIKENPNCIDITIFNKSLPEKNENEQILIRIETSNCMRIYKTDTTIFMILVYLCFMTIFVTGGFVLVLLFPKSSEKLQTLITYFCMNHTAGGHQQKQKEHYLIGNNTLTTDEVNFLRMVHMLVNVACPVVRMFFNNEIKPDQLWKTLDKNKQEMVKLYRQKDTIINDSQWYLLFGPDMGRTISSDDFDIRLMVNLLRTLADIQVGNLYPVGSDTRTGAMLSRITYITKEILWNSEGILSGRTYNKFWDDIGQAVLKLGSSFQLDTQNWKEKTRMIDRLLVLSPITVDNKKLLTFIYLSEIYPAMILQQVIYEYCQLNSLSIEELLRKEKHQLFHKRMETESCCKCESELSKFYKILPENLWKSLFMTNDGNYSHLCLFDQKHCSERFVPKLIKTMDLSMSKALILNIPDILIYIVKRLCIRDFDQFLMNNQHVIYHSMKKEWCCKCDKVPAEKKIINKEEWNKLFKKKDYIMCRHGNNDCCCMYFVRNGIKFKDIEDICLFKIFTISGPFSCLNNIEHDALLYFLNWTVDGEPLQTVLTNIQKVLHDEMFIVSKLSVKTTAEQSDARRWIGKNLRNQEATTDQRKLHVLINDEDGLSVKSVLIPKHFSLPVKTRQFEDLTTEENNFLVVVHGLTKIVYPIIKNEFNTQCPDHVLGEISLTIHEKQLQGATMRRKDGKKSRKKEIYLTPDHQRQLFSQTREESKKLDLELMIYILKNRVNYEWNKVYIEQLNDIENIRREIVQSSSGILDQTKFEDIINRISKVVLHFGGISYKDELSRLQHIRNILE